MVHCFFIVSNAIFNQHDRDVRLGEESMIFFIGQVLANTKYKKCYTISYF